MEHGNWEILRRTGQFEATPFTDDEVNRAISWAGLPARLEGETVYDWAKRTEAERGVVGGHSQDTADDKLERLSDG